MDGSRGGGVWEESRKQVSVRAVLFDLGNTLVQYWARAEFPGLLRQATGRPRAGL